MAKDAVVVKVDMNAVMKASNGKAYKVIAFTYKDEAGKEKTENIFPGSNDALTDVLSTLKEGDNVTLGFVKNPRNPKYWMLDKVTPASRATPSSTYQGSAEKTEEIRRAVALKAAVDIVSSCELSVEDKAVFAIKYAYMFMPFLSGEIEKTPVVDDGEGPY
jgi:hypothetical protein